MDERVPGLIMMLILIITIIVSAFFLSSTELTSKNFLSINPAPVTKAITSAAFVFFIIFASASIGLILSIGKKYLFKYALLFSLCGSIFGILISLLLFPRLMFDLGAPLLFFLAGIPVGIKFLNQKELELKYLPSLRSGFSASGRILIFFCIGVLVYFLILSSGQQKELTDNFVPDFINISFGSNIKLSDQFQGQFADSLITQQKSVVEQIQAFEEIKKLQTKKDTDAIALAKKLELFKTTITSPDYKKSIVTQLDSQNIDFGQEIIKQLPMIITLSKIAWIIYPLIAFSLCLFISNLLIKHLSGLIYAIIILLFPKPKSI